jgi:hypothetical protein
MINNIVAFLTNENIYLIANWAVLPFWLLLIIMPSSAFTRFLVHSIVAPLLLAVAYVYVAYEIYLSGNIFEGFELYLGLENLYSLFSEENFLLIFWLHFLSISLFAGAWISRDSQKFFVPRILTAVSLLLTYFSGPLGLFFYWFIRIFYSKKISFND